MTAAVQACPAAADPLVAFVGVSKIYGGDRAAVRELDLAIGQGEFVSILGPPGAGKTTALMMLAGFETPSAGDILVHGRSVRRVPAHRRNIGVVFRHYALFPHMTVAENVEFPLSVRGVGREDARRRAERALDLVRLPGHGRRRPADLSGGQQQRVALARALAFDPDVLLMDEPLAALDPPLRAELQQEIKRIHDGLGVTVVYVTHDRSEALALSDRIVVFRDGRVEQVGPPAEVYERPTRAFVARFIGECNRLDGRVDAVDGRHCRVRTAGGLLVRALAVAGIPVGSPTTLAIRPGHVRFIQDGSGRADNRVPARVEEVTCHGDHLRVRLAVPGSGAGGFVVKAAKTSGVPAPGDGAVLGWSADECRSLDPLPEGL